MILDSFFTWCVGELTAVEILRNWANLCLCHLRSIELCQIFPMLFVNFYSNLMWISDYFVLRLVTLISVLVNEITVWFFDQNQWFFYGVAVSDWNRDSKRSMMTLFGSKWLIRLLNISSKKKIKSKKNKQTNKGERVKQKFCEKQKKNGHRKTEM